MFSVVAYEKPSRNVRTSLEKSIRRKRSIDDSVRSSCLPAARACSIFCPLIDPDTSSTNVTGHTATLTLKSGSTPIDVGASSAKFVTCSNGAFTTTMVITCDVAADTVPFTAFDTVGLTVVD